MLIPWNNCAVRSLKNCAAHNNCESGFIHIRTQRQGEVIAMRGNWYEYMHQQYTHQQHMCMHQRVGQSTITCKYSRRRILSHFCEFAGTSLQLIQWHSFNWNCKLRCCKFKACTWKWRLVLNVLQPNSSLRLFMFGIMQGTNWEKASAIIKKIKFVTK